MRNLKNHFLQQSELIQEIKILYQSKLIQENNFCISWDRYKIFIFRILWKIHKSIHFLSVGKSTYFNQSFVFGDSNTPAGGAPKEFVNCVPVKLQCPAQPPQSVPPPVYCCDLSCMISSSRGFVRYIFVCVHAWAIAHDWGM